MAGIPHIVVARRREHDFRIVQVSPGISMGEAEKEEARWLSLDWWGNCFARTFDWAVGHFRSATDKNLFYLMLVLEGPQAPDRFVAILRGEEYARFGFDPFVALEGGLFSFAEDFYSGRQEKSPGPGWWNVADPPGEAVPMKVEAAERHLAAGGSILVPCNTGIRELRQEIRTFTRALSPATRMGISICSFTNATHGQLTHFGPILCGWYTTVWHRSLREVLGELPNIAPGGSHEV